MADIPKPDGPDVNRGDSLVKIHWGFAGVSFIVLGLRLVAGICILRRIHLADYLMAMAFACAIVQGVIFTEAYHWGMGRHFYYLNDNERIQSVKFLFYLQGWGIASTMFGRISFCCFLLKFVSTCHLRRLLLWFFIWSQAVIGPLTIILIYVQCGTHLNSLWDHSNDEKCWSPNVQRDFGFFQSGMNSLTDLYLTVLPAMILWDLSLQRARKLALVAVLSLSVFALVASLIKCYLIKELGARNDITWNIIVFQVWSTIEIFLVILCASIPHLNPLLRWGQRLSSSCCTDDTRTDDTRSLELAEGGRSRSGDGGGGGGGEGGGGGRAPNRSSVRGFARLAVPERVWSGAGGVRGSGRRDRKSVVWERVFLTV